MKKRTLSAFMCIELLYDYKMGTLDPQRKQAVEEGIETFPEVREELKKIIRGLAYTNELKRIEVSLPLIEEIANQPQPIKKIFGRIGFSKLPQPIRWGIEAVVVAVAIALFITQAPELFKFQEDTVLVQKIETQEVQEEVEVVAPNQEKLAKGRAFVVVSDTQFPERVSEGAPPDEESPSVASATVQKNQVKEKEEAPSKAVQPKGYVYRMTMNLLQVDEVTPQIVQLIEAHDGKKAGEVELGWRRKGGSYFHFMMPKENYDPVLQGLREIGSVQINKSEHPRVMPEGIERFILWVEEAKE